MWENTDQKNSEYEHFLNGEIYLHYQFFNTKFKEDLLFRQPRLLTYKVTAKYAGNHKLQYIE